MKFAPIEKAFYITEFRFWNKKRHIFWFIPLLGYCLAETIKLDLPETLAFLNLILSSSNELFFRQHNYQGESLTKTRIINKQTLTSTVYTCDLHVSVKGCSEWSVGVTALYGINVLNKIGYDCTMTCRISTCFDVASFFRRPSVCFIFIL